LLKPLATNKEISNIEYAKALENLEKLIAIISKKGGFEFLPKREKETLVKITAIIKLYKDKHFPILMSETL